VLSHTLLQARNMQAPPTLRKALLCVEVLQQTGCRPQPRRRLDAPTASLGSAAHEQQGRQAVWLSEADVANSLAAADKGGKLTRQAVNHLDLGCSTAC
jgi:hypothetical protein